MIEKINEEAIPSSDYVSDLKRFYVENIFHLEQSEKEKWHEAFNKLMNTGKVDFLRENLQEFSFILTSGYLPPYPNQPNVLYERKINRPYHGRIHVTGGAFFLADVLIEILKKYSPDKFKSANVESTLLKLAFLFHDMANTSENFHDETQQAQIFEKHALGIGFSPTEVLPFVYAIERKDDRTAIDIKTVLLQSIDCLEIMRIKGIGLQKFNVAFLKLHNFLCGPQVSGKQNQESVKSLTTLVYYYSRILAILDNYFETHPEEKYQIETAMDCPTRLLNLMKQALLYEVFAASLLGDFDNFIAKTYPTLFARISHLSAIDLMLHHINVVKNADYETFLTELFSADSIEQKLQEHEEVKKILTTYQSKGYFLRCIKSLNNEYEKFQMYEKKHEELDESSRSLEAWLASDAIDYFHQFGTAYEGMKASPATWIKNRLPIAPINLELCALLIDTSCPTVLFSKRNLASNSLGYDVWPCDRMPDFSPLRLAANELDGLAKKFNTYEIQRLGEAQDKQLLYGRYGLPHSEVLTFYLAKHIKAIIISPIAKSAANALAALQTGKMNPLIFCYSHGELFPICTAQLELIANGTHFKFKKFTKDSELKHESVFYDDLHKAMQKPNFAIDVQIAQDDSYCFDFPFMDLNPVPCKGKMQNGIPIFEFTFGQGESTDIVKVIDEKSLLSKIKAHYLRGQVNELNAKLNSSRQLLDHLKVKKISLRLYTEPHYILTNQPDKRLGIVRARQYLLIACSTDDLDATSDRLRNWISQFLIWKQKYMRQSFNTINESNLNEWHVEVKISQIDRFMTEALRNRQIASEISESKGPRSKQKQQRLKDHISIRDYNTYKSKKDFLRILNELEYHINLGHYEQLATIVNQLSSKNNRIPVQDDVILFASAAHAIHINDPRALLIILSRIYSHYALHQKLLGKLSLTDIAYAFGNTACLDLLLRQYRIFNYEPYPSLPDLDTNINTLYFFYRHSLAKQNPLLVRASMLLFAVHFNHGHILKQLLTDSDVNERPTNQDPTPLIYALTQPQVSVETFDILLSQPNIDLEIPWRSHTARDIVSEPHYTQSAKKKLFEDHVNGKRPMAFFNPVQKKLEVVGSKENSSENKDAEFIPAGTLPSTTKAKMPSFEIVKLRKGHEYILGTLHFEMLGTEDRELYYHSDTAYLLAFTAPKRPSLIMFLLNQLEKKEIDLSDNILIRKKVVLPENVLICLEKEVHYEASIYYFMITAILTNTAHRDALMPRFLNCLSQFNLSKSPQLMLDDNKRIEFLNFVRGSSNCGMLIFLLLTKTDQLFTTADDYSSHLTARRGVCAYLEQRDNMLHETIIILEKATDRNDNLGKLFYLAEEQYPSDDLLFKLNDKLATARKLQSSPANLDWKKSTI